MYGGSSEKTRKIGIIPLPTIGFLSSLHFIFTQGFAGWCTSGDYDAISRSTFTGIILYGVGGMIWFLDNTNLGTCCKRTLCTVLFVRIILRFIRNEISINKRQNDRKNGGNVACNAGYDRTADCATTQLYLPHSHLLHPEKKYKRRIKSKITKNWVDFPTKKMWDLRKSGTSWCIICCYKEIVLGPDNCISQHTLDQIRRFHLTNFGRINFPARHIDTKEWQLKYLHSPPLDRILLYSWCKYH